MYITKEQNHNTRSGLMVTRRTIYIDDFEYDEKMKLIYGKARRLRREKIERLTNEKTKTLRLIQHYQLIALEADKDYEVRQALEYIDMILKPQLTRINQELNALTK